MIRELDDKILSVARRMILEKGIIETDMKDIACELGCSRSTLYRHFPGKGEILLALAEDAMRTFTEATRIPDGLAFSTGYEALRWQMERRVEAMIERPDQVTFLRDFDCLYSRAYPDTPQTQDFLTFVSSGAERKDPYLYASFLAGMRDGSIAPCRDPGKAVLLMSNALLAVAQRVLPRRELYLKEYGYADDFLKYTADVLLSGARFGGQTEYD